MYEDLNLALGIDTETVPWHGFVLIKDAGLSPLQASNLLLLSPLVPVHSPAAVFSWERLPQEETPLPHRPAALTLSTRQHQQTMEHC